MEIRYITPFSTKHNNSKWPNIGGEYNKCIAELPDDCWIVLRDGDTMFLTPDWGNQIKNIIENNKDYDLISCMTNRVGLKTHIYSDFLFQCKDISYHVCHAQTRNIVSGSDVIPADIAPGYLMLFHKSLWQKVGGFKENSITFDKIFSNKVLKSGGKIGIATGLYLFHLYRWGQKNPEKSIKHLTKKA